MIPYYGIEIISFKTAERIAHLAAALSFFFFSLPVLVNLSRGLNLARLLLNYKINYGINVSILIQLKVPTYQPHFHIDLNPPEEVQDSAMKAIRQNGIPGAAISPVRPRRSTLIRV